MASAYVYVIRVNGLFKIGSTGNLKQRMRRLSRIAGKPVQTVVLKTLPCRRSAYAMETALHHLFVDKRHEGEWYKLDHDDIVGITTVSVKPPFKYVGDPEPTLIYSDTIEIALGALADRL